MLVIVQESQMAYHYINVWVTPIWTGNTFREDINLAVILHNEILPIQFHEVNTIKFR